jgi:hypothetical protein
MIEILPESQADLIAARLSGLVDEPDFDGWLDAVERSGAKDAYRAVIVLDGFQGWTLRGIWRRVRLNFEMSSQVACVAVVGPEEDAEIYANMTATLGSFPVEVFRPGEYQEALRWAESFRSAPTSA